MMGMVIVIVPCVVGRPGVTHVHALAAIAHQLHHRAQLVFAEYRLGRAHDSGLAAEVDPLADLERLLAAQVAGRDHLAAAPEFIAIADPSHGRCGRYAAGARQIEGRSPSEAWLSRALRPGPTGSFLGGVLDLQLVQRLRALGHRRSRPAPLEQQVGEADRRPEGEVGDCSRRA